MAFISIYNLLQDLNLVVHRYLWKLVSMLKENHPEKCFYRRLSSLPGFEHLFEAARQIQREFG